VTAIAAGDYHSLALKSDGTVVAWGDDSDGQTDVPAGLKGVTAIAAAEFYNLALVPGRTLAVSTASSAVAGASHDVTVTARAASGDTDTGYRGTIHFTSSDPAAVLPADYTFTAGDAGVHTFAAGLRLKTAGSRTVTATDTVTSSLAGSETVTVTPATAAHFSVTTANPYGVGVGHTVTVAARDVYGNLATAYRGTIHFTSSDLSAVLPADYTFTAADAGVHAFAGGLRLETVGSQWVRATDTVTASLAGSQTVVVAPAGPATLLTVSTANPYGAGLSHTVTVTARDTYGHVATGYSGTIHFTSSDTQATLPADYTFSGADAGVHAFTGGLRLKTVGSKTVTATDTVTPSITGSETVAVIPTHFSVGTANPYVAGVGHTVTVAARDAYGNVAPGYRGTIHFTSSDPQAVLPANYTFTAADAGVHAFSGGLRLKTVGSQWVRATDTVTASITGSQTVTVT
jgi:hypothetical protein